MFRSHFAYGLGRWQQNRQFSKQLPGNLSHPLVDTPPKTLPMNKLLR